MRVKHNMDRLPVAEENGARTDAWWLAAFCAPHADEEESLSPRRGRAWDRPPQRLPPMHRRRRSLSCRHCPVALGGWDKHERRLGHLRAAAGRWGNGDLKRD